VILQDFELDSVLQFTDVSMLASPRDAPHPRRQPGPTNCHCRV